MVTESNFWEVKSQEHKPLASEVASALHERIPLPSDSYELKVQPVPWGVLIYLDTTEGDELDCEIVIRKSPQTSIIKIGRLRAVIKGRGGLFVRVINQIAFDLASCNVSQACTVLPNSRGFWEKMGYAPEDPHEPRDRTWIKNLEP